jgi:polyribonucleotide nucleotidyltransferase
MDYVLETLIPMVNLLENKKVDHKDLADLKAAANMFASHKDGCKQEELMQAVNICSSKIDKLVEAVKALAEKLDAEDVANLDTNYLTAVQQKLN